MIGCMQCINATVQIEYSKSTCFLLQVYVDPGLVGISGEAEERKTTETGTKGQRERLLAVGFMSFHWRVRSLVLCTGRRCDESAGR